jgi:YidC/Oxa1 family membrane protein insertase
MLALKFLPLMIGWFALNVPSGLGLYWLANSVFTTSTQCYLRFGGGATPIVPKVSFSFEAPPTTHACW